MVARQGNLFGSDLPPQTSTNHRNISTYGMRPGVFQLDDSTSLHNFLHTGLHVGTVLRVYPAEPELIGFLWSQHHLHTHNAAQGVIHQHFSPPCFSVNVDYPQPQVNETQDIAIFKVQQVL